MNVVPEKSLDFHLQQTLRQRSLAGPVERTFVFVFLVLGFQAYVPLLQTDPGWATVYAVGACMLFFRGAYVHLSSDMGALALVAFHLLAALSLKWSFLSEQTLHSMVALTGTTILGAYLARTFASDDLVKMAVAALTFIALCSLMTEMLGLEVGSTPFDPYTGDGWRGILLHKNELGQSMSLLAAIAVMSIRWGILSKVIGISVLVASVVPVFFSDAQAAWAAMPVLVILAMALPTGRRVLTGWFGLIVIISTLFLAVSSQRIVSYFTELPKNPDALTGRSGYWEAIIEVIRAEPLLGYGYRGFWNGLDEPSRPVALVNPNFAIAHAHNAWLEIALSLGLIGLAFFGVFYLVFVCRAWRLALTLPSSGTHFFCIVSMIYLIYSPVEVSMPNFQSSHWMLIVACSLRAGGVLRYGLNKPPEDREPAVISAYSRLPS